MPKGVYYPSALDHHEELETLMGSELRNKPSSPASYQGGPQEHKSYRVFSLQDA